MKRIKDENGNIVPGVIKTERGAIIVNDTSEFNKYKQQQQMMQEQRRRIENLSSEVETLKALVQQLLEQR